MIRSRFLFTDLRSPVIALNTTRVLLSSSFFCNMFRFSIVSIYQWVLVLLAAADFGTLGGKLGYFGQFTEKCKPFTSLLHLFSVVSYCYIYSIYTIYSFYVYIVF